MTSPIEFDLAEVARRKMAYISQHRERLTEAWIAETGLKPSESVMITQDMGNGTTKTWIEKR